MKLDLGQQSLTFWGLFNDAQLFTEESGIVWSNYDAIQANRLLEERLGLKFSNLSDDSKNAFIETLTRWTEDKYTISFPAWDDERRTLEASGEGGGNCLICHSTSTINVNILANVNVILNVNVGAGVFVNVVVEGVGDDSLLDTEDDENDIAQDIRKALRSYN